MTKSSAECCVAQYSIATKPDNQGNGGGAEKFNDGVVEGVGEDSVGPGMYVPGVDGRVVVEGALLAVEQLHDRHAGDILLRVGVDPCGGVALAAVAVTDVTTEDAGDVENRRDDRDGEQRKRPAHPQHDDDDEDEDEDVFKDREHTRGEHFVEGVDVGGDARDEPADRVVIEEGWRHPLKGPEDWAGRGEHDLLA